MASQQQQPPLPLPILTTSKDCGTPYALCGGSIPSGIKCPLVSTPSWPKLGPIFHIQKHALQCPQCALLCPAVSCCVLLCPAVSFAYPTVSQPRTAFK
jgi:hypothetical protein